ncbi:MAG TPA: hypothetical protein VK543_14340 [Puia sp.]|nr:hypothetical protein [Puia sp.]
MIKFHELRIGNIVLADYEGLRSEGEVTDLNHEDKEVCVETSVQEFWFTPDQLFGIPLDEVQLLKFHFQKAEPGPAGIKYMKGPFRILLPEKGNFSSMEIWYREDHRLLNHPVTVHELQNHYHEMTKVDLTRD